MAWEPEVIIDDFSLRDLATWAYRQFQGLAAEIQAPQAEIYNLAELNMAPTKPRTGMIALADGTNWNPGSGAGVYAYYGGAWNKLG